MIIILNGPPSAGKSSIAQAIVQQATGGVFMHIESDAVYDFHINEPYKAEKDGNGRIVHYYFDTPSKVSMALEAGNCVVWDNLFSHPQQIAYEVKAVGEIAHEKKIYLIKVQCSLEICQARELARGDREIGYAKILYDGSYRCMPVYDLEVDSSATSPKDNALIILNFVKNNKTESVFNAYVERVFEQNAKL